MEYVKILNKSTDNTEFLALYALDLYFLFKSTFTGHYFLLHVFYVIVII